MSLDICIWGAHRQQHYSRYAGRGGKHTPIVRRGHTYIVGVVKSAASFFFFGQELLGGIVTQGWFIIIIIIIIIVICL
jgi:hypothetical protein